MRPHLLTPVLLSLALAAAAAPAASADRIVYASNQCDQEGDRGNFPNPGGGPACDGELWTVQPDGSDRRQLTFNAWNEGTPAWSPDGLRIALSRTVPEDSGLARIWVIGADGSDGRRVSDAPGDDELRAADQGPAWSPAGDLVAFSSGFPADVYTVTSAGGAPVALTRSAEHEIQPAFSPDGTRLAFIRFASDPRSAVGLGSASIWVAPALGGPALRVTSGDVPVSFTGFSFSPDCRRIAFSTANRIHTVSTLGGPIEPVGPPGSSEPDWSPDGDSIVYTLPGSQASNLYVLDVSRPSATPSPLTALSQGHASGADWAPDGLTLPGCRGADVLPPLLQLVGGKLDQVVTLLPLGRASGAAAGTAARPRRMRARDLHYLAVDRSGISRLEAAFGRRAGHDRCRWLAGRRLSAPRSCDRPLFARVRDERAWRSLTRRLRAGTWTVAMRGRDAEDNHTRRPLAATVRVTGR